MKSAAARRHPADSMDAPHPEQEDQPLHQFEDKKTSSPPESLLHGELEQKIGQALAELPENQRAGHPALPPGRAELRGNRQSARLLGVRRPNRSFTAGGRPSSRSSKPYLRTGAWSELK